MPKKMPPNRPDRKGKPDKPEYLGDAKDPFATGGKPPKKGRKKK